MHYDVLIIGGGAAGLMAGCALAKAGLHAALLEKQSRVGRKLLSTGNGRCNLTHLKARPEDYHGGREAARQALKRWPPEKVLAFFEVIGVPCTADDEGRVYPMSRQAASVLDALRLYCDENGVDTLTDFAVTTLTCTGEGFTATDASGRQIHGRYVILCTGGLAAPRLGACGDGYRLLKALGHGITPTCPSIAALKTPPDAVRALKGLRAEGELSLLSGGKILRAERGEMLFAEYGVSGIAAMQLARAAGEALQGGRECVLRMNFLPDRDAGSLLKDRAAALPRRPMEEFLNGIVPRRIGQALIKAADLDLHRTAQTLSPSELTKLAGVLTGWTLPVIGVQGFDQAQVTAGGARLKDFDIRTLQSLRVPGLYAAGEVLDVDGDCGGFNLQWAWMSALTAVDGILMDK